MTYIWLFAVTGILLLLLIGAISGSSVGGPMAIALAFIAAALAAGIYEARAKNRSAPGWIVNIVVSLVGGIAAIILGGMVMEMILSGVNLGGPLAEHPLMVVALAAMMAVTLAGTWGALWIVNRLR